MGVVALGMGNVDDKIESTGARETVCFRLGNARKVGAGQDGGRLGAAHETGNNTVSVNVTRANNKQVEFKAVAPRLLTDDAWEVLQAQLRCHIAGNVDFFGAAREHGLD